MTTARHDARLVPVALAAYACALAVVTGWAPWQVVGATALLAAGACAPIRRLRLPALLALAGGLCAVGTAAQVDSELAGASGAESAIVIVEREPHGVAAARDGTRRRATLAMR